MGRRALCCKTVVKEGAEAPDVVTAGTLVEVVVFAMCSPKMYM